MKNSKILKTHPDSFDFHLFKNFGSSLYENLNGNVKSLNSPVLKHLENCYLIYSNNSPIGRFSMYKNTDLNYQEGNAACIGSYECINDIEAHRFVLDVAKDEALKSGAKWLLGPMEGSTWNNYRFSQTASGSFFLEPKHHLYYNDQFIDSGFNSIAEYVSQVDKKPSVNVEKLQQTEQYFKEKGVGFRKINMKMFSDEIEYISDFCLESFSSNFLYTPITKQEFCLRYKMVKPIVNSDFVQLAVDGSNEVHSFIFAVHDYCDPLGETLIIKSIARRPNSPYRGLSSLAVMKIYEEAINYGYKKVIHAFMLKSNSSLNTSKKYRTNTLQEYKLYGMQL